MRACGPAGRILLPCSPSSHLPSFAAFSPTRRLRAIREEAEERAARIAKHGADVEQIVKLHWVDLGSGAFEVAASFTREMKAGELFKLPTGLKEGPRVPVLLILPGDQGPILQRSSAYKAAYEAMIAFPSWEEFAAMPAGEGG